MNIEVVSKPLSGLFNRRKPGLFKAERNFKPQVRLRQIEEWKFRSNTEIEPERDLEATSKINTDILSQ